jgi:hypothetical protein
VPSHGLPIAARGQGGRRKDRVVELPGSVERGGAAVPSNIIEAPWLVNGGHGASLRRHNERTHSSSPGAVSIINFVRRTGVT